MDTIPPPAQVGIVGGGIIGLSIAWRLAQAGFAVTVYEKGKAGGEASWAGAGMLSPGGEFDHDSPLARMAMEARDLYPAYVEELEHCSGLTIDLQETGALELAYSAAELEALDQRISRQMMLGIPAKRMEAKQIATFWPRVRKEELAGGYFYPGDALVNPRDVVAALRVCCEAVKVTLLEGTEASSLVVGNQTVEVNGNRFDFGVVAGGAWSSSLPVLGVAPLPESEPIRGHLVGYRQPEQTCNTIVRHNHTYLLQRASGLLITGASMERVGFDPAIDPVAVSALTEAAAFVMPHLGETSPHEVWTGFRPGAEALHTGSWQGSRLHLAYGHFRNGILLAPLTARQIAAEITASSRTLANGRGGFPESRKPRGCGA